MTQEDSHLSDERLLLDIDGELSKHNEKHVRTHLGACWKCRTRRAELEQAIRAELYRMVAGSRPTPDLPRTMRRSPRAGAKARLAELGEKAHPRPSLWFLKTHGIALAIGALIFSCCRRGSGPFWDQPIGLSGRLAVVALPDSRLTPGATVLISRGAVCAEPDTKNKAVSAVLRKKRVRPVRNRRRRPRCLRSGLSGNTCSGRCGRYPQPLAPFICGNGVERARQG